MKTHRSKYTGSQWTNTRTDTHTHTNQKTHTATQVTP